MRAQAAGMQLLYQRQLVRGKVYAIDGSGLGDDFRLVALVCVSATRPIIAAWRLLSGQASEKGQEAAGTRLLVEQVLQVAGPRLAQAPILVYTKAAPLAIPLSFEKTSSVR